VIYSKLKIPSIYIIYRVYNLHSSLWEYYSKWQFAARINKLWIGKINKIKCISYCFVRKIDFCLWDFSGAYPVLRDADINTWSIWSKDCSNGEVNDTSRFWGICERDPRLRLGVVRKCIDIIWCAQHNCIGGWNRSLLNSDSHTLSDKPLSEKLLIFRQEKLAQEYILVPLIFNFLST